MYGPLERRRGSALGFVDRGLSILFLNHGFMDFNDLGLGFLGLGLRIYDPRCKAGIEAGGLVCLAIVQKTRGECIKKE